LEAQFLGAVMGIKLKKTFFSFLLLVVFLTVPVFKINAQSTTTPAPSEEYVFPQWAKDIRRFEIIAFGSFPFAMFFSTIGMDTYRWLDNGFDWSDSGRRYAPWPLKSAGAIAMTNDEYKQTITIAACLSGVIAIADMAIVHIKRNRAKKLAESMPAGSAIIISKPWEQADDEFDEQEDLFLPENASDDNSSSEDDDTSEDADLLPIDD